MKIVVLDGNTLNSGDLSWNGMKELGELVIYDRTPENKIIERAKGFEIVITNKTPLSKETIEALPDMQYIGVLATGYNVVDIEAAKERKIPVSNIPSYGTESVAQMVFAHILEFCHHIKEHSDSVKEGVWSKGQNFCYWNFPLIELSGLNMGIIGFGRIGQKVAEIASAFGMNILAYDVFKSNSSMRGNFKWAKWDEILSQSDIISLHCPLFPETQGIINKDALKKMKKTAILINTSRGPLIVEEDLAEALKNGEIAGAGLDVLNIEPPHINNQLFKLDNCNITPHIAWATKSARSRLMNTAVENIKAFMNNEPQNVVNK